MGQHRRPGSDLESKLNYETMTSVFRKLALEAGEAILQIYHSEDFDVRSKSDESPVTAADVAADQIIAAGLAAAFPDVLCVTEEQAQSHELSADTFFIVDPLDGTKEFIKRRGEFTVNIAFVENGVPLRGIVYAPAKERMFYTRPDGATVEEKGPFGGAASGPVSTVAVSAPRNDALTVVASKSHRDKATDDYIGLYSVDEMISAGSSLKFCLVATGEADIYPRLGRTMEWDTAAGQAVLLGAGGKVVRFDDHTALTYGKPGYENPFFIAYAPGVGLKAA